MLRLDLIITTHNRAVLLRRAVESVFRARRPEELGLAVHIVDNASTDDTVAVANALRNTFGRRVSYLYEPRGGKSQALNTGIAATNGELVGMIDDDEEVEAGWLAQVARAFTDPEVDFIGGPYIPRWSSCPPDWLPSEYLGALGWADSGRQPAAYGRDFPGMLKGGNAVIRRRTLERVGLYATHLGPTPRYRLMSCEDEDMYLRLLAAGARGLYVPDLIVYHHVGTERLTRRYFRRWCFWRGVSQGLRDRHLGEQVPRIVGVPRWIVGAAARASLARLRALLRRRPGNFAQELALWDVAGFFYGRHFYRARG